MKTILNPEGDGNCDSHCIAQFIYDGSNSRVKSEKYFEALFPA